MKKRNLIIAIAAIIAVCLVVVICCVCIGKSNPDTNTPNTEQTTTNTEINPGSENSDHNDNDDIIDDSNVNDNVNNNESDNTDNNGSENVEDDTSNDNNTDVENDSSTSEPSDETENDNNDETANTPYAEPAVVGFALYVCEANSSLPYSNGQKIEGVLTTLEDGRNIYVFGDYEVIYISDIVKGKVWSMNCEHSDNLVYCSGALTKRNNGTYYAGMSAYYVNTTGKALVYYTASVYRHNDNYYLVANTHRYNFVDDESVVSPDEIIVQFDGLEVDVYTYITLDTEMYDGLYDGFTITFYDDAEKVVGSETYTNDNLPDEITWKLEAYTASITHYYEGEAKFVTYKTKRAIESSNKGYDWNTVVDGIGYHHHISWILEN